jgi:hypothetical protein
MRGSEKRGQPRPQTYLRMQSMAAKLLLRVRASRLLCRVIYNLVQSKELRAESYCMHILGSLRMLLKVGDNQCRSHTFICTVTRFSNLTTMFDESSSKRYSERIIQETMFFLRSFRISRSNQHLELSSLSLRRDTAN